MAENLEQVKEKLKDAFDSVSEKDGVITARKTLGAVTRADAIADMRQRLEKVYPKASIVLVGSVGRPTVSWYIQFEL